MRLRVSRLLAGFLLAALPLGLSGQAPPAAAQAPARKPLTLEAVFGEKPIVSRGGSGFVWRDRNRVTWVTTEGFGPGAASTLWEYDATTGKKTALLVKPMLPPAAKDGKEEKPKPFPLASAQWAPGGGALVASADSDLWLWRIGAKPEEAPKRLTNDKEAEEHPLFSLDGTKVAYAKKHDLYVLDVATGTETRLTTTGAEHVLNGTLDWVYEEELAGRRRGRTFEWAPDSKALAYIRLDETLVPEYPIVDYTPTNGKVRAQRYPKAGDPNSIPSVHVVGLDGVETASYRPDPDDVLIAPELSWTPDGKSVALLVLDRVQTHVDVFLLPRAGGKPQLLLSESDPAWINAIEPPRFLKDGSGFLFRSEASGFMHLRRHAADGSPKNSVTSGPWMVDGAWDVDEKNEVAYVVTTEKDPRERHVYRISLGGTGLKRLTAEEGTHGLVLSPGGEWFVSSYSSLTTTPRTTLRKSFDGSVVTTLDEPANTLADYALPTVELGSFRGKEGTLFYTKLLKPPGFDPSKTYPVVVSVYGGPHAQVVRNGFASPGLDALLASKGILVWSMDNRGSWGRGHAFEAAVLKNLGTLELADQLEGIAELKKRPYVDGSRIGIHGWSYGGYMTLFAATHAGELFRSAIAGAPVTDWKLYDSIYTERYMKLPKENAEGYKTASNLLAAGKLGTKLLILHGTSDDNVHMQNTILFADELMKARKDYDFVPLPRQPHGPREPAARLYTNQRMVEFFEATLLK